MPPEPTYIPAADPIPMEPVDPFTARVLRTIGADVPSLPEPEPIEPPDLPVDPAAPAPVPDPTPAVPVPDPAPAAPTPAPVPDPGTPPPAPVPDPAAPPAAPAAPVPAPRGRNRLDRIEDAVAKLADAVSTAPPPAAPGAPPAPAAPAVDPKIALRLEAVEQVAGPQAAKKYEEFLQKDKSFRQKWEQDHPGKRFDASSEEYAEFRDAHEPDVPAEDVIRAEATIAATRAVETRFNERLQQERISAARERAEAEAREAAAAAPAVLLEGYKADDKFATHAAKTHAREAAIAVREVHRLFTPGTQYQLDPSNPIQRTLLETAVKYDKAFADMPEADSTLSDGRKFLPSRKWSELPAERRADYWTVAAEPRIMASLVLDSFKARVASTADALRREFGVAAPAPAPAPTPPPAPPAPAPAPPAGGAGAGTTPGTVPPSVPQERWFN